MMKFLSLYIVRLSRPSPKSSVESPGRGPYWSFGFLITCVRSGFSASQLSSLHRLTSWESLLTEAHLTAAAGSGSFLPGLMREGGDRPMLNFVSPALTIRSSTRRPLASSVLLTVASEHFTRCENRRGGRVEELTMSNH